MKHEIRQVVIYCDGCEKELYCAIHEGGCHEVQLRLNYRKIGEKYFCCDCQKNLKVLYEEK